MIVFNNYIKKSDKYDNLSGKYDNLSEKKQLELVHKDPLNIKHISNPSEKVQLKAVSRDGDSILFIYEKNIEPSEQVKLTAVKQNGVSIRHIKKPSRMLKMYAVIRSCNAIKYIEGSSDDEELQMTSIRANSKSIRHIDNPSVDIQLGAVRQNIDAIFYIKNPNKRTAYHCIISDPDLLKINDIIDEKHQKLPGNYFQDLPLDVQEMLLETSPCYKILIRNLHPSLKNSIYNLKKVGLF